MKKEKVSVYDKYGYDYSTYWKNRQYEHAAEVLVLDRIFSGLSGDWIVDVGGSYGRHVPRYHQKFHNCILLDYSINSLRKAKERLHSEHITNVHLVAANAYYLPIRSSTMDAALMVRVLHHLDDQGGGVSQMKRVVLPDGKIVIEFANKTHLKAIAISVLRGDFKIFSCETRKVPNKSYEGAKNHDEGIMNNYHPNYIRRLLESHEVDIYGAYSLSFLRIPFLKKLVPYSVLVAVESMLQKILGWTLLTPSVIFCGSAHKPQEKRMSVKSIRDVLVCPKCNGDLSFHHEEMKCHHCSLSFTISNGIYDLRYPSVTP